MVRAWLQKHRWVNELGKIIIAVFFLLFAYVSWEGGKLASIEIAISDSYKLMIFGIVTGSMGTLALYMLIDVLFSVIDVLFSVMGRSKGQK